MSALESAAKAIISRWRNHCCSEAELDPRQVRGTNCVKLLWEEGYLDGRLLGKIYCARELTLWIYVWGIEYRKSTYNSFYGAEKISRGTVASLDDLPGLWDWYMSNLDAA